MRLILFTILAMTLTLTAVRAQSVMDNLPPVVVEGGAAVEIPKAANPAPSTPSAPAADPYMVADVNADVTADNASHARDQALMQAERNAYVQLCGRLGVVDNSAKLNDDALAGLVQSFEVQSEHLSAVRYIGIFTIRFKPSAVAKKVGGPAVATAGETKIQPQIQGPVSHMTVAVQSDSLAAWSQIKKRLGTVPQVAAIEVLDLGRGVSHINLSYGGLPDDLKQAAAVQGLVLRQNGMGTWELYDGSMVSR